jgi:hypothetical protein
MTNAECVRWTAGIADDGPGGTPAPAVDQTRAA